VPTREFSIRFSDASSLALEQQLQSAPAPPAPPNRQCAQSWTWAGAAATINRGERSALLRHPARYRLGRAEAP
jgi:hypothetical protein